MSALMILALTWAMGCGEEAGDSGDSSAEVVEEEEEYQGCLSVEVGFEGPNPPHVGDTWTVWHVCDGVASMGATIIRVSPVEAATVFENELTWQQAGAAELMTQGGSQRAWLDVEVLD